jgi:hypothetical protein
MAALSYSQESINYISANAATIKSVATILNVSSTALTTGVIREMNLGGLSPLYNGYKAFPISQLSTSGDSGIQEFYDSAAAARRQDPLIFSGQRFDPVSNPNPVLADIGPGKIRVLTAMDILKEYQGTPIAAQLGLDQYDGHWTASYWISEALVIPV